MNTRERKIKQRIERRKEKVLRMIGEQEALLIALEAVIFLRREDYRSAQEQIRGKLYRLQQELQALESGILQWKE